MNPLRLFLLLVVLAGLAAGLSYLALRPSEDPTPILPEATADALIPGNPEDLRVLRIERPRYGQRVSFELKDRSWRMTEPVDDEADVYALGTALEVIFGNDYRPALPIYLAQTAEQLGLDKPDVSIELEWADGTTSWLRIGAQEPAADFRVAERQEGQVRLPLASYRKLARAVQDWRNHRLHPFGVTLTEVAWEPTEGQPLRLRQQGQRWRLVEPIEAALSDPAHDMLLALLGARLIGMGLEEVAFDAWQAPIGQLNLFRGKEEVQIRFSTDFGVQTDRRPYSLTIDPLHMRFLSLPLEEIQSPFLLDFEPDQIASIGLEQGESVGTFQRQSGSWADRQDRLLSPEEAGFLDALLRYGKEAMRGEPMPVPEEPHSGKVMFSISRQPKERGSAVLRWWVQADGSLLISAQNSTEAYTSSVNFEAGVADFFRTVSQDSRQ